MTRVLLTCLALAALASPSPSRAATVLACQDANGSDWPVSPQHPCPVGPGTLAYTSSTSGVAGTTSGTLITAGQYRLVKVCTLFSSTTNVWLNLAGGAAVVNSGLGIPAGGGCKTLGAPDTPAPTSAVTAITDGVSGQTVTITGG